MSRKHYSNISQKSLETQLFSILSAAKITPEEALHILLAKNRSRLQDPPSFDDLERGFKARRAIYRDAFKRRFGKMPKANNPQEDYCIIHWLSEMRFDEMQSASLTSYKLRNEDRKILNAVNTFIRRQKQMAPRQPICMRDILSTPQEDIWGRLEV